MSFRDDTLAKRVFIPRGMNYRIKTPPPELEKYKPTHLVRVPAWLGPEFEFERTGMHWSELVDYEASKYRSLRKAWMACEDGSLRGADAAELKARKAMNTQEFDRALDQLFEASEGWSVSKRTGFHLHVDVGTYTMQQLYNLFSIYALLEPAIYTAAGDERSANPFSVPWFKDPYVCQHLLDKREQDPANIGHRLGKYSGLNVESMQRFGTVEWRHRRNTKDRGHLVSWINLILTIHAFAYRDDVSEHIERVLKDRNYRRFIGTLYANVGAPVYDRLLYPELEEEIDGMPYELASELYWSHLSSTRHHLEELLLQKQDKKKVKTVFFQDAVLQDGGLRPDWFVMNDVRPVERRG